ncbi:MAG: nicotinate (nicotinamide) nucleotide adenylyltransferase [Myxococcaceae bacterium]
MESPSDSRTIGALFSDGSTVEVALFGGSFNPPQVGHLLAAHYVHATQPVDEVWLMPAFNHAFKKNLVPFEHRKAMCDMMREEANGWLKVSGIEAQLGGEGRTVDTLEALGRRYPNHHFSLVIGADIVEELPKWKNFARIQELVKVIVLNRPGYRVTDGIDSPLSVEVSSTEARRRLAKGESATELVPRRVLEYAKQHSLYE